MFVLVLVQPNFFLIQYTLVFGFVFILIPYTLLFGLFIYPYILHSGFRQNFFLILYTLIFGFFIDFWGDGRVGVSLDSF